MDRLQNSFMSIEQVKGTYLNQKPVVRQGEQNKQSVSFEEMLSRAGENNSSKQVIFSKHANERLASRNINLND